MEKRTLGKTGLSVTPLGFGAAQIGFLDCDRDEADRILNGVLDAGIRVIDTAACYADSEELIGEVISHLTSRGGIVVSLESRTTVEHIRAEVPLARMFGYSTALRSMTQGRGTFAMEFAHFKKKEGGL